MAYGIYFINKSALYLEVGFENSKQAKRKLEEIANCFVDSPDAVGEIWCRNDYVDKRTIYGISYDDCRAFLCYRTTKKDFRVSK